MIQLTQIRTQWQANKYMVSSLKEEGIIRQRNYYKRHKMGINLRSIF
jgi:hypothetical protein